MTNTAKLKAVIVEKGMLQEQVAMQLGMTSATFNYKVNNKTEFKASEIKKLSEILKLTDDEVIAIFFAQFVDYLSTYWLKSKFNNERKNQNEHFFKTLETGNG